MRGYSEAAAEALTGGDCPRRWRQSALADGAGFADQIRRRFPPSPHLTNDFQAIDRSREEFGLRSRLPVIWPRRARSEGDSDMEGRVSGETLEAQASWNQRMVSKYAVVRQGPVGFEGDLSWLGGIPCL